MEHACKNVSSPPDAVCRPDFKRLLAAKAAPKAAPKPLHKRRAAEAGHTGTAFAAARALCLPPGISRFARLR